MCVPRISKRCKRGAKEFQKMIQRVSTRDSKGSKQGTQKGVPTAEQGVQKCGTRGPKKGPKGVPHVVHQRWATSAQQRRQKVGQKGENTMTTIRRHKKANKGRRNKGKNKEANIEEHT